MDLPGALVSRWRAHIVDTRSSVARLRPFATIKKAKSLLEAGMKWRPRQTPYQSSQACPSIPLT